MNTQRDRMRYQKHHLEKTKSIDTFQVKKTKKKKPEAIIHNQVK